MIFKAILLVILSNSVLIEGISYCCPGLTAEESYENCTFAVIHKKLGCENKYVLREDDPAVKYSEDNKDLILDGTIMSPNEYCKYLESEDDEIIVVCFEPDSEPNNDLVNISRNICTVLELISIFFIILTIIVYLLVPKSLHLQNVCILYMITGIAVAFLTLAIINLSSYIPSGACEFLACALYFSLMFGFFWLNLLCFHIWREVVQPNCLSNITNWKIIYHVYGMGAPLLTVWWVSFIQFGNFSALQIIHPGIGEIRCWFKSTRESIIYFIGPVSVLIFINIVFFVSTIVVLWKSSKHCTKTKIFKYRLRMYLKLFFVMGITWIFEILSTVFKDSTPKSIWIITDIINALQGVIIFFVLVIFRKSIKSALANRRIVRWRLPHEWKNERDSECEELDEDINLETSKITKINLDI